MKNQLKFAKSTKSIMKNTTNKLFSRHTLTNAARIAAIVAACVTMSALTLPKPPVAPPTEITFNIDSTDTTDSSGSSDSTQSNLVSACVCDLNQDHAVDSADLGTLLGSYGPCPEATPGDFNFDGVIDSSDLGTMLVTMLENFGPCPSDLSWATVLQWNPDSDVVLDADVRAKIVASGFPWRVLDTGTGIEMLLIPDGTFTMGGSSSNHYGSLLNEIPTHQVTLSKAFYLGKTEVTQEQWQATMGSNPSSFNRYSDSPSRPVDGVSWNDIAGFNTATGMRLPTEAEWEYAYRGGSTTAFHSMPGNPNGTNDDNLLGDIAWYSGNNGVVGSSTYGTKPVAGKAANAFGIYDMSGNVMEWCNDWYGSKYYSTSPTKDPAGPATGTFRVLRGGLWSNDSSFCRSSYRNKYDPDNSYNVIGFRAARTP